MPWATTSDVTTYTGLTVTGAQVEQAQAVVELFADTTEDASDGGAISAKNLRLLKLAVSYQAAWITQHPDAFTSMDTTSVSQDQVSATWLHANAGILAPLATRCIDRLSWKRIRPLRVGRRLPGGMIPRTLNFTSAIEDDNDPRWQALGSDGGPC
ncbi:hypothetical protein [Streptomyces sp. NPDC001530]|uniref:hypothetical protein n=1 Tax=Streptomyces sp. NPDC001530 TaxID=3364582 RepID=UPI0036CA474E